MGFKPSGGVSQACTLLIPGWPQVPQLSAPAHPRAGAGASGCHFICRLALALALVLMLMSTKSAATGEATLCCC